MQFPRRWTGPWPLLASVALFVADAPAHADIHDPWDRLLKTYLDCDWTMNAQPNERPQ